MSDLTDTERAWLACAIDGEGSITINKGYRKKKFQIFYPHVSVSNTSIPWILEVKRIVEKICPCNTQIAHAGRNLPLQRVYVSSFKRCVPLLEAICPWLIAKVERAKNILAWAEFRALKAGKAVYTQTDLDFIAKGRIIETSKWKIKTNERTELYVN